MKKHPPLRAHGLAKALRRNMTDSERSLWNILRSEQIEGYKLRRQVPIGRYIADFACHEAKLIIEVDGGQHDLSSKQEKDRTAFLQSQGYSVLRFWNNEVLENSEGVYVVIKNALSDNHPHPTLPHQGGGLCASGATCRDNS